MQKRDNSAKNDTANEKSLTLIEKEDRTDTITCNGRIEGRKVDILLDTGSTASLIDEKIVQELNLKQEKLERNVTLSCLVGERLSKIK